MITDEQAARLFTLVQALNDALAAHATVADKLIVVVDEQRQRIDLLEAFILDRLADLQAGKVDR